MSNSKIIIFVFSVSIALFGIKNGEIFENKVIGYVEIDGFEAIQASVNQATFFDYICLSSAEYGQLDLPVEYKCPDCTLSEKDKEKIELGWGPERFLLVRRKANILQVELMKLSKEEDRFSTSYQNVAFRPHTLDPQFSQCTTKIPATLACRYHIHPDGMRRCLPVFQNKGE